MFFLLSKILWAITNPFNLILLLIISGWLLLFKKPKLGKKLVGAGLILIFLFGLSPIPNFMMSLLENRISVGTVPTEIDGIIILVGMVDMEASRYGLVELTEQSDRIVAGVILARKHPEAKLIITGGTGFLKQSENLREADYLERLAMLLGVDKNRIIIERNSRNTHEHAIAMAKLLSKNGQWVLITSAFHMPRSFGCFKKAGLNVIPCPVDYKTKLDVFSNLSISSFLPSQGNLSRFSIALHEWLALITYRLMGYTGSVFPRID